ncbi:unnamed protein product [Symbiodinium sp. KB8]|nr:unnamed protein product [Symbiodinium sp. KB8]
MDFEIVLTGIRNVWDKLQAFGATCGATTKTSRREEVGLTHVFVLHPLDSEHPEATRSTQRGARLLHEGRADESIRELHDARELAPRSHVACCNLGCAYQTKNDDRAALYWYREAHRLDPHDETATFALALLEQRRGQAEEARRLLMAFLQEVDSSHVGALRQLGRLHQRECHWSQAAGCFHRLIAVDPTNDEWPAQLQVCLDQVEIKDGNGQAFQGRAFSFDEAVPSRCRSARRGGNDPLSATSTTCSSWTGPAVPGAAKLRWNEPGLGSDAGAGPGFFHPIQESQSQSSQSRPMDAKDAAPHMKPVEYEDYQADKRLQPRAVQREDRNGPLTIGAEPGQKVFAAGDNRHGQLGIGHKKDVNAAVRVGISAKVKAVAAGCTHSLMITESGDVYAAGDNNHGQLGTGGTQGFSVPVKMDLDAGSKAISAAAGCWFSLLLLESGAVYGVGLNSFGQLGVGSIVYPADHTRPVKMQLAGRARSIAAGCTHSLVLLENGDAYATGDNLDGQLGIGNTQDQARPKKVLAPSNVVAIAAGTYHSLLLLDTSEVAAVGSNLHGQLGLGSFQNRVTPEKMLLDAPVQALAAGDFHSLVLLESGDVYSAGDNGYGQLGIGSWDRTPTPRQMVLSERIAAVDAGWSYSLMVAESGEVLSAGYHLIHSQEAGHSEQPNEVPKVVSLKLRWSELIQPEHLILGPQLGAGGSAQVFQGRWKGQEVAVKRISGVAHLEAMKKEIDALRRLRHPRLVRFIGACLQPPLLLVVTEYMSGGSLHDCLFGPRKTVPLSPRQRWTIACQTAEGLSFLHSQRVVHRDLKSMNILLDSSQNAKICDFGLAHQMCMESTHIARKLDGEGGSPRYMAPECYDAKIGKLTEKVDIWAAGCILIELFAGTLPYADCQTMPQLTARILVEKRPPDVAVGTPPQMVSLIGRCVMFDPRWRLGAPELLRELTMLTPSCILLVSIKQAWWLMLIAALSSFPSTDGKVQQVRKDMYWYTQDMFLLEILQVGIAELAEVLCRSNELDLEVLFENISSWNAAAHFQDDHEMGDVPNRLVGLIAEASHRSQWDRASVAVYDEMLDDALLAGSQGSSPSAADFTEKQSLAELVRSLASFLLELLPLLPLADMCIALCCEHLTGDIGKVIKSQPEHRHAVAFSPQQNGGDIRISGHECEMLQAVAGTAASSRQQQQLQQVTGEQLLEWNLDLALRMNRHPSDVVSLSNCEVAWGSFRAHQCVVTFSSYSFVLEGPAFTALIRGTLCVASVFADLAGSGLYSSGPITAIIISIILLPALLSFIRRRTPPIKHAFQEADCRCGESNRLPEQCDEAEFAWVASAGAVCAGGVAIGGAVWLSKFVKYPGHMLWPLSCCDFCECVIREKRQFAVTAAPLVQLGAVMSTVASQLSQTYDGPVGPVKRKFETSCWRLIDCFKVDMNAPRSAATMSRSPPRKHAQLYVALLTPGADTVRVASSLEEPNKVDVAHSPMKLLNGTQDLRATEASIAEDEASHTATTGLKGMEAAAGAAGLSLLAVTSVCKDKKHNVENAVAVTENVVESKSGTVPADAEEQELRSQPGGTSAGKESQESGAAENSFIQPVSEQDRQIQAVEPSAVEDEATSL